MKVKIVGKRSLNKGHVGVVHSPAGAPGLWNVEVDAAAPIKPMMGPFCIYDASDLEEVT